MVSECEKPSTARESLCSSNGEDGVGGRTSAETGNVSDSPMGTSGGSDERCTWKTYCL